jgi:hypothetical protein
MLIFKVKNKPPNRLFEIIIINFYIYQTRLLFIYQLIKWDICKLKFIIILNKMIS